MTTMVTEDNTRGNERFSPLKTKQRNTQFSFTLGFYTPLPRSKCGAVQNCQPMTPTSPILCSLSVCCEKLKEELKSPL